MKTVSAVYENGVFRPLEEVDLPADARVEVLLPAKTEPLSQPINAAILEVLSRRDHWGETDLAARHNEHQP